MNERIRELAEQARKALAIDAMSGGEFNMKAYEQKFAELIVRECIKLCDGNHEYKNHTDTFFGKGIAEGIQICKIQIAQHFGVE